MRRILPRRPRWRATACLVIFLVCVTLLIAATVLASLVGAAPSAMAAGTGDTAGGGTAGSGTAGSGTAGSGTAGSATAGSATAGSATAGSATAGSATAGSATAGSATAGGGAGWVWPLRPPPTVLRGFAPPAAPWGPGHRGVDLAASVGQQVRSAGAGVVTYAGMLAGRGVVSVTHGALRTTYEPVGATVSVGQRVGRGHVIGTLERRAGHCGGRACLHWGLLRGEEYLDPLALLRRGPSRLLPIWQVPAPAEGRTSWDVAPASPGPASPGPAAAGAGSAGTAPAAPPEPAVPAGRLAGTALAGGAAMAGAASAVAAVRHRRGNRPPRRRGNTRTDP